MLRKLTSAFAFLLTFTVLIVSAQAACTVPNTLTNGTTADATAVMGNFTSLAGCAAPLASPSFTGNVGIGTATPGAVALNIVSSGSDLGLKVSGVANQWTAWFQGSPTTSQSFGPEIFAGTNSSDVAFRVGNSSASSTNFLLVRGDGNVGIGVTSPSLGHLQVQGNGDQYIAINSTSGGDQGFYLFDNGAQKWRLYNNPAGANAFSIIDAPQTHGVYLAQGNNSWSSVSDARLKTNVASVNVLDRLAGFRAVSFRWRADNKPDIGVIAQEIDQIFPEAVTKGSKGPLTSFKIGQPGVWGVDYAKLAPIALEGVKELRDRLDQLKASNDQQSAEIQSLRQELAELRRNVRLQTASTVSPAR